MCFSVTNCCSVRLAEENRRTKHYQRLVSARDGMEIVGETRCCLKLLPIVVVYKICPQAELLDEQHCEFLIQRGESVIRAATHESSELEQQASVRKSPNHYNQWRNDRSWSNERHGYPPHRMRYTGTYPPTLATIAMRTNHIAQKNMKNSNFTSPTLPDLR